MNNQIEVERYEGMVMRFCPNCNHKMSVLGAGQHSAEQLKCPKCKKFSNFQPVYVGQPKIVITLE